MVGLHKAHKKGWHRHKTPAPVRQFFNEKIYCELMKNDRLTKTKTYLEEKDHNYIFYYTRFGGFDKYFFPTF